MHLQDHLDASGQHLDTPVTFRSLLSLAASGVDLVASLKRKAKDDAAAAAESVDGAAPVVAAAPAAPVAKVATKRNRKKR